jgi:mannose-6-phosphate isomerase-like protein (cupin superfamily)
MKPYIGPPVAGLLLMLYVGNVNAQKVDHYSTEGLKAQGMALRSKLDAATGSYQQVLEKYPNHLSMLILREKDGQAELHEKTADVIFAVDGTAELWTGGEMKDAKQTEEGERRGSGLAGGTVTTVRKGDIVHIPANVPHQVRIATGGAFTYIVLKVREEK